ncbi:MAG: hydroxymethylglutaryl-CoA synthase [Pseudomonadota bacterium]
MSQQDFGISGLSVFVPPYRVQLQDWCQWTGGDWAKISAVVGHSFRLRGPEDSVYTMAAQAALRLIIDNKVDPTRVGYLALATESSSDNAIGAVIVRGLLDQALEAHGLPPLSRNCEVPELKQACIAGLYGVKGAIRYLAHDGAGRCAIVVSADAAEYELGSTGEPTQGAGAVATLVEQNPKLLALDLAQSGSASNYRIADFRKPFVRYAEQEPGTHGRLTDFPVFNGKYSTACYLDEVICAFDAMFTRRKGARAQYLRELAAAFMHRPYRHMPVSAWTMAYLFALGADGGKEHEELAGYCAAVQQPLEKVLEEMRSRPRIASDIEKGIAPDEPYPLTALVMKAFRKSAAYKAVVEDKLQLGADLMMNLGNLYTAALPAWLAAGFEDALDKSVELTGRQILLVGYGSGDAADAIPARVMPGWEKAAVRIGLKASLGGAVDLSQDGYRTLHGGDAASETSSLVRKGFLVRHAGHTQTPRFTDTGIEYYEYRR